MLSTTATLPLPPPPSGKPEATMQTVINGGKTACQWVSASFAWHSLPRKAEESGKKREDNHHIIRLLFAYGNSQGRRFLITSFDPSLSRFGFRSLARKRFLHRLPVDAAKPSGV
ncbi:MAG TPA: hypothetical protein VN612_07700 [Acidobacteriaceae bacterium]|nr:hypothetical protein [Acidobacteriaceae bacterium]